MLVRPHEYFARALNEGFALGAFNTSNLEMTQAIIWGAQRQRAPVIVQTSAGAIGYAGLPVLAALVKALAQTAPIPVVLHLDHGGDIDAVKACIEAGYTSVMIDASRQALEDNVGSTSEVVKYAHDRGVWVEAELGEMLGSEGASALGHGPVPEAALTDPAQAVRFVRATGVDALAVSVGTIHGAFTGQEYIRFELVEQLQRSLPHLPLVLHGASGIADRHLKQVAQTSVCKINVDTELRLAFAQAVRAYVATPHDTVDPRDMLGAARDAAQAVVEAKLRLLGTSATVV